MLQRTVPSAAAPVLLFGVLLAACATGEVRQEALEDVGAQDASPELPLRPDAPSPDTTGDAGVEDPDAAVDTGLDAGTADAADVLTPDVPDGDAPDLGPDAPCVPGAPGCEPLPPPGGCCEARCQDGSCESVAGACEDRCEFQRLSVGATCTGCGAADADGVCVFAQTLPCDATNATACFQQSCGGQTWYCTQEGGTWGWRTTPSCDDGNPCTDADQCLDGACQGTAYVCEPQACPASRCEGNTHVAIAENCSPACDGGGGCTPCECVERPKPCETGPGNVCCTAACDPVLGCTTRPGSCGTDVCTDPNRLVIAGQCNGCGADNASGSCTPATELRCDAAVQTPCQQTTCGGTTFTCTNVGGVWQWRTAEACDDGNACTWGDRCAGGSCQGTTISCLDSECLSRTCNGTATCVETPRTGSPCNDGNACTPTDTCSAAGVCVGAGNAAVCGDGACTCGETNASCSADCAVLLPANACATGSQSRDGCGNARVIGRSAAAAGWSSGEQNTCSSSTRDRHEGDCSVFDVGPDHTYAVYLLAGERATVTLAVGTRECASGEYFNSRLKFKFNASNAAGGATSCPTSAGCWAGPREDDTRVDTRTFDATSDGWLFVILDGGATAFDEHRGYYTIGVTLGRCTSPGCGC